MQNPENRYPAVNAVLKTIGVEFVAEYRELILSRSLSQSGALPDSMSPEVITDDDALNVAIALSDYWLWVEKGRGPGKRPPLSKIEGWIERTGIVPSADANGRTISIKSLAFLIARKIGREGTEGKHIIRDIVERDAEEWANRIRAAAAQDVKSRAMDIFSKLKAK